MSTEIRLTGFGYDRVLTEVRVSNDGVNRDFATINVYTGGCSVQAYAKAQELRDLAHALTVAADKLEIAQ